MNKINTVELEYCDNTEAEIPVMFIDKQIGDTLDEKGRVVEKGIDGDKFMKELMYLSDTLGKKTIEVWINSPGGLVTKGQSIYHGILTSKASVNTVCYGIAASISGVIFQAGKRRKMTDFATLMYHPAFNPDGSKDKGLDAMNDSVIKMIATRTSKTEDDVWKIMNAGGKSDKGTWLDAKAALENGFCDEIIKSSDKNNNKIADTTTIAKWEAANRIYNRTNEPKKNTSMKNVCNKLGLVEDSNEASVLSAIEAMNKKAKDEYTDLLNKYNAKCTEMETLDADKKVLKDKLDAYDTAKAAADVEAKNKLEADVKAKTEAELTNAVGVGKIKNEAAILDSWRNLFAKDFDGTKKLIDAMNASGKSPVFTSGGGAEKVYNTATIMYNINNPKK